MAMTVQTIIDQARILLRDDGTRWPDSELIPGVNRAQQQIFRFRPDSSLDADGAIVNPPEVDAVTDSLVIQDKFEPALTQFTCYWAISKDTEYTQNKNVAAEYWSAFHSFLLQRHG